MLVCLTAPYVFLRLYLDDYSQGTSLTLVDVFLLMAALSMLLTAARGGDESRRMWHLVCHPLFRAGLAFVTLSALSGLEGVTLYQTSAGFSFARLLSGTSQYAFILMFVPLLASHYLTIARLRHFMRWLSLGYFLPMVLTLVCLPHSSPERLRELFFFSNRALGSYGNANAFSGLLVVVFPYYIFLAIAEKGLWRALGYFGVTLSLACLFLTVSFSGGLSLVALIAVNVVVALCWRRHPMRTHTYRLVHMSACVSVLLVALWALTSTYLPSAFDDVSRRLAVFGDTNTNRIEINDLGNGAGRMELIRIGLEMISARHGGLLTGHGIRESEALPEFSFAGPHQEIHVIYLLLWVEGGFILLACFCAYLALLLKNAAALAAEYPSEAVVAGSAVVALALFGFTYPHLYLRYFWVPLLPAFPNWARALAVSRPMPVRGYRFRARTPGRRMLSVASYHSEAGG